MNECIAQIHSNFQPSKKKKKKTLIGGDLPTKTRTIDQRLHNPRLAPGSVGDVHAVPTIERILFLGTLSLSFVRRFCPYL